MSRAVVLYTWPKATPEELGAALAAVRAAVRSHPDVEVHLLHYGLTPEAVTAAVTAYPALRFLRANVEHYEQFPVPRPHHQRLLALDALRLEGHDLLVLLPASAAAVPVLPGALAWTPDPAAEGGDRPDPSWRKLAGRPSEKIFLIGGGLAGPETMAELDRRLAVRAAKRRSPLWMALAEARQERLRAGAVADGAASVLLAHPLPAAAGATDAEATAESDAAAADATAAAAAAEVLAHAVQEGEGLAPTGTAADVVAAAGAEAVAAAAVPDEPEKELSPVDQLLAEARARVAAADFHGAREILMRAVQLPGGLRERVVFTLSRVLRALSQYDAARAVLHLAHSDHVSLARAAAEEAEIAWVQHDYAAGADLAVYALRANPLHRAAEIILRRCEQPLTVAERLPERTGEAPVLSHVAFYVSDRGNFGDVALPPTVRESVASVREPAGWLGVHAHQVFDRERLELVNRTQGVVIGGGGLFLPDTSPNGNSGWQWNVPPAHLDAIEVPIAVVAVGFNLFEGQGFYGNLFRDNLIRLVERAELVGLRNRGSVRQVRRMLPDALAEKVTFLPCPTTVLAHIHQPGPVAPQGHSADQFGGAVLINTAFDRSELRFGERYGDFLAQMAAYVRSLRAAGAEVRFAAHLAADEQLVDDLRREHDLHVHVDALYDLTLEQGYEVYRRAGVVVGMRGHATMIPFGLGTPVLSLVSHPKMRYFLEDIERPEWGFDVLADDLAAPLTERTLDVLARQSDYRADVAALQLTLLDHVQSGLRTFTPLSALPVPAP